MAGGEDVHLTRLTVTDSISCANVVKNGIALMIPFMWLLHL